MIAAVTTGCAHASPPGGTTPAEAPSDARVEALQAEARRRAEEIRELESQLALARARAAAARQETVRIGGETQPSADDGELVYFEDEGTAWDDPPTAVLEEGEDEQEAEVEDDTPRPVLRLHEERRYEPFAPPEVASSLPPLTPSASPPATLPAPVAAGGWRASAPPSIPMPSSPAMPVATTPVATAPVSVALPAVAPTPRVDPAEQAYAQALGLLRERRVQDALRAFDTFLTDHGGSSKVASARYWRAEALYVLRRYGEAQAAFDAYLVAHPRDARAPDALLKLGLCHEHMGDRGAALRTFERLRREFPSSVAARLASREDA